MSRMSPCRTLRLLAFHRCALLMLGSLLGLCTTAAAADPKTVSSLSQPLSLGQCLRLAVASAPVALSQRARLLDAAAAVAQARALPNPSLSYVAQDLGIESAGKPLLLHQAMIGFSPFVALLRVQESRAACRAQAAAQAAAASELRALRRSVGLAYYELRYLHTLQALEAQAVALVTADLAHAQTRYQQGDGSGLDVLRAQAEHTDARRQEQVVAQQALRAEQAFSVALGAEQPQRIRLADDAADAAIDLSAELSVDLSPELSQALASDATSDAASDDAPLRDALLRLALRHRPELGQAAAERHHATELGRLATLRALPLADAQLAVGLRSAAVGNSAVIAITGSLSLFDFQPGPRLRAQAQGLQAQARSLEAERQIALEVTGALQDLRALRQQQRQQVEPLLALRAQIVQRVRRQFREGVVPFGDVAQASRDLLAAQRARAAAVRDVDQARWRLVAAVHPW